MALVGRVAAVLAPVAHAADGVTPVTISVGNALISKKLGEKFAFHTTITNRGSSAASGLIAHLNVLSLRDGPYVDPEDWSTSRTRYLETIPAGGSVRIKWPMHAVNAGSFGVYIAVLPESGIARPPQTGPTIRLEVASRRTLNSGGILPLALGIPAFLGALTLGFRFYRGR